MKYKVLYVFPIEEVYDLIQAKLPPWQVPQKHAILSAVIRYWLTYDLALPLTPVRGDEHISEWSHLLNNDPAQKCLRRVIEGPLHPAWNPQFSDVPSLVKITPRSLYLWYLVDAPPRNNTHV